MSAAVEISCPNCGKKLKVPAELAGKRVKCKDCQEVFAVPAPKPAKPAPAAKPAAAPPPPPKKPYEEEEDDDDVPGQPARVIGVIHESDIPRCPHCAFELDPPEAEVCLNCGFNNRTRVRAESKRTVAPDAMDWVTHLAPGVLALLIVAGLVTLCVLCWTNMSSWLEGTALELEEKDLAGNKKFMVKPGAFTAIIIAFSVLAAIPAGRFAVRRLILGYRPEEKVTKK